MISKEDWIGRRLVADQFRAGNVFIAGDAAHLWVPYAGFGMNAGIADATNLAWLLGARLQGWAEEAILDAYAAERQPITEQVSQFAMDHAQKMIKARGAVPAKIEAPGRRARRLRAHRPGFVRAKRRPVLLRRAQLRLLLSLLAAIVAGDGEVPPPYTMDTFTASTVPGCRAPHFWLADGRSLYDAFGPAYTLLRFDRTVDVAPLLDAAATRRMPLTLLDIDAVATTVPPAYRHALVACRSDQHVAWRGDRVPAAPAHLVDVLRGAVGTPGGRPTAQPTASWRSAPPPSTFARRGRGPRSRGRLPFLTRVERAASACRTGRSPGRQSNASSPARGRGGRSCWHRRRWPCAPSRTSCWSRRSRRSGRSCRGRP